MLDSSIMIALLSLLGVLMTVLATVFGVVITSLATRVQKLEENNRKAATFNQKLWSWCRRMIDLYYRNRKDGSPDPEPLPNE